MGVYDHCKSCGKKTLLNHNTNLSQAYTKTLCKECAASNALVETVQSQKDAEHACNKCLKNLGSFEIGSEKLCRPCFEEKFGTILLSARNGQYHGGHKAFLAGGYSLKYELGMMYLTQKHFVFVKLDKNPSKRIEIIIPLYSVLMEGWGIEEESRRQSVLGAGIGAIGDSGIGGMLGTGTIHDQGKAHHIVIPYIDENGITQVPRFGISSYKGKAIRQWADKLYQLIVEIRKNVSQSTNTEKPPVKSKTETENDPLHVLKMRLAKGEITKDEYEELHKMLES